MEKDIREAVIKYGDMLYRICIVILCNEQDVQDAIQDTFCRYLEKRPDFHDEEHRKAWLIRVATNICRDMIRFRLRHPKISIDDPALPVRQPFFICIMQKGILYLYKETADILGITKGAVVLLTNRICGSMMEL